jgi:hypothetical protein
MSAAGNQAAIAGRAKREPEIHNHALRNFSQAESTLIDRWLWIPDNRFAASGMTNVIHQNFTCGGFSAPSLAVNSAIGFSPENAVFAQMTVGKVRSAVL